MARTRRHPPVDSSLSSLEIPAAFTARKQKILLELQQPDDEYTDKSPKGNVDVQIRDLIDEINDIESYVTTSSCAGRVAVFVEGGETMDNGPSGDTSVKPEFDLQSSDSVPDQGSALSSTRTSPGGKGGGHWLFVSHDPISNILSDNSHLETRLDGNTNITNQEEDRFTKLFRLSSNPAGGSQERAESPSVESRTVMGSIPRLVHLSFSPLILHIHCASLWHARPLLSAAINAGFRESGVQSLRALDDPSSGVMVAIRTAGLAFETVVGVVEGQDIRRIVNEEYLGMCAKIVNERFKWNDARRERLRAEIRRFGARQQVASSWEDEDQRKARKRREGLLRQQQQHDHAVEQANSNDQSQDGLGDGLATLDIG